MSIRLMTQILDDENITLSGSELLALVLLADHANDDGVCWPSMGRIARRLRLGERYTRRVIHTLEELGYVHVMERGKGRTSTRYRITPIPMLGDMGTTDPLRGVLQTPSEMAVRPPKPSVEPPVEPSAKETIYPTAEERAVVRVIRDSDASQPTVSPSLPESEGQQQQPSRGVLSSSTKNHARIEKKGDYTKEALDDMKSSVAHALYGAIPERGNGRVWGHINTTARKLIDTGATPLHVDDWLHKAWAEDWRGKKGQRPTPTQLLDGVAVWLVTTNGTPTPTSPTSGESVEFLDED